MANIQQDFLNSKKKASTRLFINYMESGLIILFVINHIVNVL
jgi:hypothetical protein